MKHPLLRAALLAALLPLATTSSGCSPTNGDCAVDGGAALAIGYGDPNNPTTFRPLTEGASVGLTPGPQGGQHVWTQLVARNLCGATLQVRLRVVDDATNTLAGLSIFASGGWAAVDGDPGARRSALLTATVDMGRFCGLLASHRVRIEAQASDTAGRTASATVRVSLDGWSSGTSPGDISWRAACCADTTNSSCWPEGPPDAGTDAGTDATRDAVSDVASDAPRDGSSG